jgi:hypothetical protein
MKLSERIDRALDHAGLSQASLANAIQRLPGGTTCRQQTISRIKTEQSERTGYAVHIAVATGVRPEWLALERGSMVTPKEGTAALNLAVLTDVIAGFELMQADVEKATGTSLSAREKAKVIVALYESMARTGQLPDEETLATFVRLAS